MGVAASVHMFENNKTGDLYTIFGISSQELSGDLSYCMSGSACIVKCD